MNRIEFMTTLASLLQDIPAEERREAMQYYNDYFDEAGAQNEAQVITELGDPEKVAAIIKEGIEGFDEDAGEFTDTGYHNPKYEDQDMPEPRISYFEYRAANDSSDTSDNKKERWTSKPLKVILIIAIILCAVPVIVPLALGIVAAAATTAVGAFSEGMIVSIIAHSVIRNSAKANISLRK